MTAEKAVTPPAPQTPTELMKDIVALCKRRGFIFGASDIYGGINGFWDYGPLGVELKNNLRDLWWKKMVLTPPIGPDGQPVDIVGLDSAIIQNPKVWVASGHVGGFSDLMTDCKETKKRYRVDNLTYYPAILKSGETFWISVETTDAATTDENAKKKAKKLGIPEINTGCDYSEIVIKNWSKVISPEGAKPDSFTDPKAFNLLFETYVGAVQSEDNKTYLRGETAQGIFINFKNVVDSSRVRVPFGIAQVGKAFRNEVNPRNFIFRSREFEQMEMEWFCHPNEAKTWFEFWKVERQKFWESIGLSGSNILMREHDADELVFYSKGTFDIEYKFPFTDPGFGELEGIAYRGDYDLTQHQEHSKTKLEYMDPVTNERYIPHVIEPAAGLTRGVLAVLCEAYTVDPKRPSGVYLNFHPALAPKKAAILPLTAKDEHPVLATKLYLELREEFAVDLDIKQNIGKRYARQDEIGTPFCFTIDDTTVADGTVTVRERNTMAQERIPMANVAAYLREKIKRV
jgi:glycyl-tRNA synthetase